MPECNVCARVALGREHPNFLHEFEHSLLFVGDHQFHPGYCVAVLKDHVRDMHELPRERQLGYFAEVMEATEALVQALHPAKINHACYGNLDPHLHWHIFPRYADDPDRTNTPWLHMDRFADHPTTAQMAADLRAKVSAILTKS